MCGGSIIKDNVEKYMPQNIDELKQFIVEWERISQETIKNLIDSMKNRCELILENNSDILKIFFLFIKIYHELLNKSRFLWLSRYVTFYHTAIIFITYCICLKAWIKTARCLFSDQNCF